ncbi:Hydrophobin-B [Leucoagaricus sp. SymC.cos]|nr:Hydrophobin-B [Leucoagaricus sp. SymC.cos]
MVAKFFALAALATAVVAGSTCSTGPIQCCNSAQKASSPNVRQAIENGGLDLISVLAAIGNVDALVGLTCSPISVAAVQGNQCSAQTVCCENNNFNGVVALGCTPINVNV